METIIKVLDVDKSLTSGGQLVRDIVSINLEEYDLIVHSIDEKKRVEVFFKKDFIKLQLAELFRISIDESTDFFYDFEVDDIEAVTFFAVLGTEFEVERFQLSNTGKKQ